MLIGERVGKGKDENSKYPYFQPTHRKSKDDLSILSVT